MAMRANAFDNAFQNAVLDTGAPIDEKIDSVFETLRGMPVLRQAVQEAIETQARNSKTPGWGGPSMSQQIRNGLAAAMNAAP